MAYKLSLILLLLAMIGATSSCTKEETTIVEYEPITLAGRWNLTSWFDAQLVVTQNYPAVLDSTIINFTDTGRVFITSSCTGGNGYYLHTQTKELMIYNFNSPNAICGEPLQDETQQNILAAVNGAYSFDLNGDELTLRNGSTFIRVLNLRKLE